MSWDWLNIVGTVAFATSGAVVAMEEGYDLLGVVFLGLATAFGGGVLRNVLLGQPVSAIWSQEWLLIVAIIATLAVFLMPRRWLGRWRARGAVLSGTCWLIGGPSSFSPGPYTVRGR